MVRRDTDAGRDAFRHAGICSLRFDRNLEAYGYSRFWLGCQREHTR
jgi:hypothetical protein